MAPPRRDYEDDDDEDSSTPESSPTGPTIARRHKFEDEEDDSDVVDSWDAAENSDVEREKAKKAAEAKARVDAEAAANKKSKSQRIEDKRTENMRRKMEEEEESSSEEEDEAEKRERLRKTEQAADLRHAEDMFDNVGISKDRSTKPMAVVDPKEPNNAIDLSTFPLFNPTTKDQFLKLRETLVPILTSNSKKAQYTLFLPEFTRQLVKDLPSEQIKKIASGLTTLSNEKMKEEKAAEKGGKKSKAAKSKTSLVASRDASSRADTTAYDEADDEDFM